MALPDPHKKEKQKNKEGEELLNSLFDSFGIQENKIVSDEAEEEETLILYIWPKNKTIFDIYCLCQNFYSEYYALPENILLELLREEKLPIRKSLEQIAIIHNSFLSVVLGD